MNNIVFKQTLKIKLIEQKLDENISYQDSSSQSLKSLIPDYKYFGHYTYDSLKDTDFAEKLHGKYNPSTFRLNNFKNSEKSNMIFRKYLVKFSSCIFADKYDFGKKVLASDCSFDYNPLYKENMYSLILSSPDDYQWKNCPCPLIHIGRTSKFFESFHINPHTFDKTLKKFISAQILIPSENNKNWSFKNVLKKEGKLYYLNILGLFQSFILHDYLENPKTHEKISLENIQYQYNDTFSNKDIDFITFDQITDEKYHNCFNLQRYTTLNVYSVNKQSDEILISDIINRKTANILLLNQKLASDINILRTDIIKKKHIWIRNLSDVLYNTDSLLNFSWKDCPKNTYNSICKKISDITGQEYKNIKISKLEKTSFRYSTPNHHINNDLYDIFLNGIFVSPIEYDVHSSTYTIAHALKTVSENKKYTFDKDFCLYDDFIKVLKQNNMFSKIFEKNTYQDIRSWIKIMFQWYNYRHFTNDIELGIKDSVELDKIRQDFYSWVQVSLDKFKDEKIYDIQFFKLLNNYFVEHIGKKFNTFMFALEDFVYFNIEKKFLLSGICLFRKFDAFYFDTDKLPLDIFEQKFAQYFVDSINLAYDSFKHCMDNFISFPKTL